jgi:hypothetical protein
MHARSSAAGQAIGKQFKNATSGMLSTCLITAIMASSTYKPARPPAVQPRSPPYFTTLPCPWTGTTIHDCWPFPDCGRLLVLVLIWCERAVLVPDDLLSLVTGGE